MRNVLLFSRYKNVNLYLVPHHFRFALHLLHRFKELVWQNNANATSSDTERLLLEFWLERGDSDSEA